MGKIILESIKFYQLFISPYLGSNCRFYPSCSDYFIAKVKKEGALKGSWQGFRRILRCHPFSRGGIDLPDVQRNKD